MPRKILASIPKTVWVLGAAMFLLNTSVIVIFSLSSLFLNAVVGVNTLWIGLLEGCAEALSFLMKLFSGVFSDYLKRRKKLIVVGYALAVISKPLMGVATGLYAVVFARVVERLGNGIQSTPRDALIGDVAPPNMRGACYGFQRGLGLIGCIVGAFLAYWGMVYFEDHFQTVFLIAGIPALLALILVVVFLKEPKHAKSVDDVVINNVRRRPIHMKDLASLGKTFWVLMAVIAIFWFARVSEAMIVLHAHNNLGLSKSMAPLIMMAYNCSYCVASFVCGYYSDKIGRYWLIAATMVVLMVADYIIFNATTVPMLFAGILVWGVQMGMSMNLFTAKIADLAPEDLRGTAFGCYYLISALSTVLAGLSNGTISHNYGVGAIFLASLLSAGLALVVFLLFLPKRHHRELKQ